MNQQKEKIHKYILPFYIAVPTLKMMSPLINHEHLLRKIFDVMKSLPALCGHQNKDYDRAINDMMEEGELNKSILFSLSSMILFSFHSITQHPADGGVSKALRVFKEGVFEEHLELTNYNLRRLFDEEDLLVAFNNHLELFIIEEIKEVLSYYISTIVTFDTLITSYCSYIEYITQSNILFSDVVSDLTISDSGELSVLTIAIKEHLY